MAVLRLIAALGVGVVAFLYVTRVISDPEPFLQWERISILGVTFVALVLMVQLAIYDRRLRVTRGNNHSFTDDDKSEFPDRNFPVILLGAILVGELTMLVMGHWIVAPLGTMIFVALCMVIMYELVKMTRT